MNEEKKEVNKEEKNEETKQAEDKAPAKRQIIIETDGNAVDIVKADIAGSLELIAILESILNKIRGNK